MNTPAPSTPTIARSGRSDLSGMRLYGRWLVIARVTWFVVVGLVGALFIASMPPYVAYLHTLTTGVVVDLNAGQLTPAGVRALQALDLSIDFYAIYHLVLNAVFLCGFLGVGSVLFWRKAENPMALLTSFALVIFPSTFLYQTTTLPTIWLLPTRAIDFLGGISISLVFYLFPNGRFVPGWTRWLMIGWVIYQGAYAFIPWPSFSLFENILLFTLLVSLVAVQIYRYRHVSTSLERLQIRWVIFGFTVAVVGFLGVILPGTFFPAQFQPGTLVYFVGNTALHLFLLCIPLSLGIAILRSHLWNIDLVINRMLVYGILTASVVSMYVLVVGYLGTLLHAGSTLLISLFATGLVAVLFQPLRGWLQRGVNRLMYGQRDEPYTVVARLGRRLESTLAPEAVLPAIVETVAQALKLPYAAITLRQGEEFQTAAVYGAPVEGLLAVPLSYHAEPIGQLLLGPRQRGDAFTPADRRLVEDLGWQVGVAAHAVRLTVDLQRSRERLVTAREEERRRLRRDLHDGLGPTLAALALKATTISEVIPRDPAAATQLSNDLYADIRATVGEIRRLVYDLRPPTLDELGVIGAIRECAAQYSLPRQDIRDQDHATPLQIRVEVQERLPPLPAAVEVAAYRLIQEALTNVARHAQAHTCTVRLKLTESLLLEVSDDGIGVPSARQMGVGLLSMRERAAELGGSCVIESSPGAGTRIRARFPIPKEASNGAAARPDC